jgi:pimeloyl-ACP methyl ester carboxylesterase
MTAAGAARGAAWTDSYWHTRDGLRMHYRDYPGPADRPAILCLAGLSRNCRDFDRLAARFRGDWRIIAPSLRGRGKSDCASDPSTYVPDVYVDDLFGLLDALALAPVVIVGTSLGARLAVLMAGRDPSPIVGAVLNDLGPVVPPLATASVGHALGTRTTHWPDRAAAAAGLRDIHAATYPRFGDADWEVLVLRLCREDADGGISLDYDPAIGKAYRSAAPIAPEAMWAGFEALAKRPVLSVRGALSTMLTEEVVAQMGARARYPLASVTIADVGHAPTLDEPEAVAAIDALLGRVLASDRGPRPQGDFA